LHFSPARRSALPPFCPSASSSSGASQKALPSGATPNKNAAKLAALGWLADREGTLSGLRSTALRMAQVLTKVNGTFDTKLGQSGGVWRLEI